jgi:hypothetical protein
MKKIVLFLTTMVFAGIFLASMVSSAKAVYPKDLKMDTIYNMYPLNYLGREEKEIQEEFGSPEKVSWHNKQDKKAGKEWYYLGKNGMRFQIVKRKGISFVVNIYVCPGGRVNGCVIGTDTREAFKRALSPFFREEYKEGNFIITSFDLGNVKDEGEEGEIMLFLYSEKNGKTKGCAVLWKKCYAPFDI